MRTRITVTDLRAAVDLLNRTTNATPGSIGSYVLEGAYGGWQVQRIGHNGGAIRNISTGFLPARELLERISFFRYGYEQANYERGCADLARETIYKVASVRPEPDACPVTGDTYGLPA